MTRSPTRTLSLVPGPSSLTTPAHSKPKTSVVPGGGGYKPRRCSRSARLSALAWISIATSPRPGAGSGSSTSCSFSGPPGSETRTAFTVRLSERGQVRGSNHARAFAQLTDEQWYLGERWRERLFAQRIAHEGFDQIERGGNAA